MSSSEPKAIIGILGYFGHGNVGDEAMLACWLEALGRLGAIDRTVVFTADCAKTAAAYAVQAVQSVIPTSPYDYVVGALGRNRASFFKTLRAIRRCRALIVGGGSLFHDRPQTASDLFELLKRIELAINRRQTVLLLGVGVGPLHRKESKRAITRVLSKVNAIAVRDQLSRSVLEELGVVGPEISTTGDPVFLLTPPPESLRGEVAKRMGMLAHSGPRIGLCLRSVDLFKSGFRLAVVQFCRHLLNALNAELWFFSLQTGGGEDDRTGARHLAVELSNPRAVHVVETLYSPSEAMAFLASMAFIIGEKLHSLVFATQTGTPFLAISYDPKVRSFATDIGHAEWCVDLDSADAATLQSSFDRIWSNRDKTHAELGSIAAECRKRSQGNLDLLKRYLLPIVTEGNKSGTGATFHQQPAITS